jgi:hypothetical protein
MPSEFWAAILGALAAGGGGYLAQRVATTRGGAEFLCRDVASGRTARFRSMTVQLTIGSPAE